jgi:hypothetical protein
MTQALYAHMDNKIKKKKEKKKKKKREPVGVFPQSRHTLLAVPSWDFPSC